MVSHGEQRGGVAPLGDALSAFLRSARLDRRLAESQVLAAWNASLGDALAQRARALRFVDGELVVEVASAAHLQELSNFTGEGFRRTANKLLGAERIQRVTFQPRQ